MPDATHAPEELGLRERKKILTRETIASAAFELVQQHGIDEVTVNDIAERAFVSPRTVSNYFSSKEAAIVAADEHEPIEMLAGFDERPEDEPPLQSLRAVLAGTVRTWTDDYVERLRAKEQLIDRAPALLPHRMAQYDELEDAIRIAVAQREGVDPDVDPFSRLIAGAAAAAVKTAIRVWVNTGAGPHDLAELVEHAFDDLESGLSHAA
ncbi:TetR/AcrR family transcriptional regulator [Agrococcus jenensis]|uniref:TetR family transcriptional regulator n=1 Tax=Agrococcus jenensis TaxID=46353 RepID=A0A3N2ATR2_9MICO|nr:TetR/AcrR family transcriptional regulator [Agrococcus jenensis]ROR66421.1 TetR family transcriptional regulator [Agrococcus jenensis]